MKSRVQGITIVEVMVGLMILSMVLVFVVYTLNLFFTSSRFVLEDTKATYLAEEGLEFARFMRDNSWTSLSSLTTGTTYYFSVSGSSISATTTPEIISGAFTRSLTVSDLRRSASGDVVSSGGSVDTNGRVVTVTVTWDGESRQLQSILSDAY
jgi:competence protein ComGC